MSVEIRTRQAEGDDLDPVSPDNPLAVQAFGSPTVDLWTATDSFARPSDTTQYAAADALANSTTAGAVAPLHFGGMGSRSGGSGLITNVLVWKSTATITSAAVRLYILNAPLPTAFADNAAFNLIYQDVPKVVGVVDFVLRTEGGSATVAYGWDDTRRIDYQCAVGDETLYGYLVNQSTYTPASGEIFFARLTALRNP